MGSSPSSIKPIRRWEHKPQGLPYKDLGDCLRWHEERGWELVGLAPTPESETEELVAVFKRPVQMPAYYECPKCHMANPKRTEKVEGVMLYVKCGRCGHGWNPERI
jgi:hypothetical protein